MVHWLDIVNGHSLVEASGAYETVLGIISASGVQRIGIKNTRAELLTSTHESPRYRADTRPDSIRLLFINFIE
jgi:hypothetical protein